MRRLAYLLAIPAVLCGRAFAQTAEPPAQTPPGPPPAAETPPTAAPPPVAPVAVAKPGAPAPKPVTSKSEITLYGTVELTGMWDSVESDSFLEAVGNALVPREDTYAGKHNRFQLSPRGTRLGLRLALPDYEGIKVTGLVEGDFVGNQPSPLSQAAFFTNPTFRLRHGWAKVSYGGFDLTVGQTWYLFGWVPNGVGYSVMTAGVPGAIYGRAPQVRLGTAIKGEAVTVEVAVAAFKPTQRDSGVPDGQAGVRLMLNNWKGIRTPGPGVSVIEPLSIGVSGVVRHFDVIRVSDPSHNADTNGYGIAGDILVPIVPAKSREDHQFALTLSAEAAFSQGCADLYTGLTGGAALPTTSTSGAAYAANIDNGLVLFDSGYQLQAIKWAAVTGGLQFYLSNSFFIASNFGYTASDNITDLTAVARRNTVYKKNIFVDASIVWDVTPAFRAGVELGRFMQTYADDKEADATRLQFGFWYFF